MNDKCDRCGLREEPIQLVKADGAQLCYACTQSEYEESRFD